MDRLETLEFWFEFASTYSYVAAMRIEALCRASNVPLVWRPFLLGPIFELQGWNDSHYNINPRRGAYMWRDLERLCAKFGLPWHKPSAFPRATVLPARIAIANVAQPWIGEYVRRTYVANFGEDRDIGARAVQLEILASLDLDAEPILENALAPANKSLLREATERAVAIGICGAPNCVVGDELFWGEETLEDAIAWALPGNAQAATFRA